MATSFKSINCKEIRYHFVRHKSIILQWTITFFSCQSCLPQYTVDHPCYVVNFWYHTIQWHHQESRKIAEMSLLPKPINRDSTKQVVQTCEKEKNVLQYVIVPIYVFFPTHCVFSFLIDKKPTELIGKKNHVPLQIMTDPKLWNHLNSWGPIFADSGFFYIFMEI